MKKHSQKERRPLAGWCAGSLPAGRRRTSRRAGGAPWLLGATLLAFASPLFADGLSGRAEVSYQSYDYGSILTQGMRQQYDLRLERAFTTTSIVRVFFRGDDFQGNTTSFRQLQPGAEMAINTDTLQLQGRADYFDIRNNANTATAAETTRTLDRRAGRLSWTPVSLPRLDLIGQRNKTHDTANSTDLTDEYGIAMLTYEWRSLQLRGEGRYSHLADPIAGYDQKTVMRGADVTYATTMLNGKLTVGGQGTAQLQHLTQSATAASSVPTPVIISRATWGVDDTPTDDRDHPLTAAPLLTDGNVDTSAGISLGPESVSFQNIALDIGRIDRVDEIRVVVRDVAGNPMRNGGGPVTWDAYTSQDGTIWTPLPSTTTFNQALSLYSINFTVTLGRWFKVVSFGVNSEPTFITEVQAYYHAPINPGVSRQGNQNLYNALASVSYQPWQRLTLTYAGSYNSLRQEIVGLPNGSTNDTEHLGGIEYRLFRSWAVRAQYLRREITTFATTSDRASGLTTYLDYNPTPQLRMSLEAGHQTETLDGSPFNLDTKALHTTAYFLRSLLVTSDVGVQTQTLTASGDISHRQFANLSVNAQLRPTLRMILIGTLQRTKTDSTDPAVALLGPIRDERVSTDLMWRPGRQLTLQTVLGWAAGQTLSGFTQRYHVEWYPFGDGTVSLGGSYDQDIDPAANRKASRVMFTPRWAMNRHVAFDLNLTRVRTTSDTVTNQQKLLFATVTVTR